MPGGKQTTRVEQDLPPWVREHAETNLDIANEVFSVGYTPNPAPTVAALSPMQEQMVLGVNKAAQAFGLPSKDFGAINRRREQQGKDRFSRSEQARKLLGLPEPQSAGGGFKGYSPRNTYEKWRAKIDELYPAAAAMRASFTTDPVTGQPPQNPAVPMPQYRVGAGTRGYGDPMAEELERMRLQPWLDAGYNEDDAQRLRDDLNRIRSDAGLSGDFAGVPQMPTGFAPRRRNTII